MRKCKVNSKRGFTIIEVVLVLAIAGLIFLMVFLALPALQRSQRDTQRRDQLSMLVTQLTQYQANNRNRLPQCDGSTKTEEITPSDEGSEGFLPGRSDGLAINGLVAATNLDLGGMLAVEGDTDTPATQGSGSKNGGNSGCSVDTKYGSDGVSIDATGPNSWLTFYKNYLMAQGDVFEDPLGQPYGLQIEYCGNTSGNCEEQRNDTSFDAQAYKVLLTYGSVCDGETVVGTTGARRMSVAYKLEGGGTYCQNN